MAGRRRGNGQGSLFKRRKSGSWIARWYDHAGKRLEASTRTTDKAAAERILRKWVADTALRREGVIDPKTDRFAAEGRRPIADHIADYTAHCRHVGHAPRHVDQKERHLGRLMDQSGVGRLSDLTADVLECHLRGLRDDGLSARTANFARQIAVAFVEWCVKTGRAERNALKVVPRLDEEKDRRRIRRPLTDAELARLLAVAEPRGRKPWYLAAVLAGLRKGDLQRLTWADLDFDARTITVRGGKSGRTDLLPMHDQLAVELLRLRDTAMALPSALVFPTTVTDLTRLKDFLRAGLAREVVVTDADGGPVMVGKGKRRRPKTKIVAEDEDGRVIDLHAMRTTLGTRLARAGVAPQIAQRIMRHADYRTTLRHYTVLGLADTARAVAELPGVRAAPESAVATGTCDLAPASSPTSSPDNWAANGRSYPRPDARTAGSGAGGHGPRIGPGGPENAAGCRDERPGTTIRDHQAGVAQLVERQPSKLPPQCASAKHSGTCGAGGDNPTSSPTHSIGSRPEDRDLRRLVDAWPSLPEVVRAGIVALVDAAASLDRP